MQGNFKVKALKAAIFLLLVLSLGACATEIPVEGVNPYVGVYQAQDSYATVFAVLERDNQLYVQSGWGIVKLKVAQDNTFTLDDWKATGKFSQLKKGQFQLGVAKFDGQNFSTSLKRIGDKLASIDQLYTETAFTKFDGLNQKQDSEIFQ